MAETGAGGGVGVLLQGWSKESGGGKDGAGGGVEGGGVWGELGRVGGEGGEGGEGVMQGMGV